MYKGSSFTLKKCQVAAILSTPLITFLLLMLSAHAPVTAVLPA